MSFPGLGQEPVSNIRAVLKLTLDSSYMSVASSQKVNGQGNTQVLQDSIPPKCLSQAKSLKISCLKIYQKITTVDINDACREIE